MDNLRILLFIHKISAHDAENLTFRPDKNDLNELNESEWLVLWKTSLIQAQRN